MSMLKILALGGDGIGPEVVGAALRLADAVADHGGLTLDVSEDLLHGAAWEMYGTFCRESTVAAAKAAEQAALTALPTIELKGLLR
jgi:3-isopropylmalate dehydrogenase